MPPSSAPCPPVGALLIRLLYTKYVAGLHWHMALAPRGHAATVTAYGPGLGVGGGAGGSGVVASSVGVMRAEMQSQLLPSVLLFLGSVLDRLEAQVQVGVWVGGGAWDQVGVRLWSRSGFGLGGRPGSRWGVDRRGGLGPGRREAEVQVGVWAGGEAWVQVGGRQAGGPGCR